MFRESVAMATYIHRELPPFLETKAEFINICMSHNLLSGIIIKVFQVF